MASIRFFRPSQECPGTREGTYRIAIDGAVNIPDGVYAVGTHTYHRVRQSRLPGQAGSLKYMPKFRVVRKLCGMSAELHRDIF